MISYICPQCKSRFDVRVADAGRTMECPDCGKANNILQEDPPGQLAREGLIVSCPHCDRPTPKTLDECKHCGEQLVEPVITREMIQKEAIRKKGEEDVQKAMAAIALFFASGLGVLTCWLFWSYPWVWKAAGVVFAVALVGSIIVVACIQIRIEKAENQHKTTTDDFTPLKRRTSHPPLKPKPPTP